MLTDWKVYRGRGDAIAVVVYSGPRVGRSRPVSWLAVNDGTPWRVETSRGIR